MNTFIVGCGVILAVVIVLILSGCWPVIAARSGGESGIPYYLPKPYLLITKNLTPLTEKIIEKKDDKGNTIAIERTVEPVSRNTVSTNETKKDSYSFQVIYLPDLTKKTYLEISSGIGHAKTNITLVDGWKLVGINLEADAKISEIIKAIGEVIPKVPIPTKGVDIPPTKEPEEKEVGLWLYEIKVENGKLKYELVIQWPH